MDYVRLVIVATLVLLMVHSAFDMLDEQHLNNAAYQDALAKIVSK